MKYIIEDWAGNKLHYNGKFVRPELAVPMEFESFEDGWGFIYERHPEAEDGDGTFDDYYVMEVRE
jgi:hypothetical protein